MRPRDGVKPLQLGVSAIGHASVDLDRRPMLVFWEVTRACLLACRHCRASAIASPLPGELSLDQADRFLRSLTGFGRPYPVLVLTGGDVLNRSDLLELVTRARKLGLPVAVSPSVTRLLEPGLLSALHDAGVKVASISLDGATPETHEGLRGVAGHFETTLAALRLVRSHGFTVQVNTVVRPENVDELPKLAAIVSAGDAAIWEVFFLIHTGRGNHLRELSPEQNDDVCHFLYDASCYGAIVRTVEAPFFRRVAARRREGHPPPASPLYTRLSGQLRDLLGEPTSRPRAQTKGTRDGKGIIFVAHDGDVYPAGFLPLKIGSVKRDDLVYLYRESPLMRQLRNARFRGRCGICEYAQVCGGSRARAYAECGDALAEDPGCPYQPVMR